MVSCDLFRLPGGFMRPIWIAQISTRRGIITREPYPYPCTGIYAFNPSPPASLEMFFSRLSDEISASIHLLWPFRLFLCSRCEGQHFCPFIPASICHILHTRHSLISHVWPAAHWCCSRVCVLSPFVQYLLSMPSHVQLNHKLWGICYKLLNIKRYFLDTIWLNAIAGNMGFILKCINIFYKK